MTVPPADKPNGADCLAGGGEMGALMRSLDWSKTPLGAPDAWPQSLKTAVRIMLTSRQPIWIGWGPELTYLYNDPYKSIIGGKHPWALGKATSVVWREIWNDIEPLLSKALGGVEGTYVEAQLLVMERHGYKEETYYTFSYSPVPDDSGGVGGIICANTDDTRRVIGERQLRTLRDLGAQATQAKSPGEACRIASRVLAENTKDIAFALVYMKDEDGQAARLLGSSQLEEGGPACPMLIDLADDSAGVWPVASVLASGSPARVTDLKARFGNLPGGAWDDSPHEGVVLPVRESESLVSGVLVLGVSPVRKFDEEYRTFFELAVRQISTIIGNARAYEEERRRAEALAELDRAKTAFFSNVSHEFRTPLTLMLGPLEDALSEPLEPAQRERMELLQRNALRLQKLVNTLLDFSRIEAGRVQASYQPTDLAGLTAELASVFRSAVEKAGLRLIVDCRPLSEPAYVDRDMWEKIVLNLVSNAFKFTLEGEIEVTLSSDGDSALLRVRDTGSGIAEDQLPHIFDRFHRVEGTRARTEEGTGIGLALVQELVRLHGGTVSVESVRGRGTTFAIRIPLGSSHLPADRIGPPNGALATSLAPDHFVGEALKWVGVESETGAIEPPDEPVAGTSTSDGFVPADSRPRVLVADDNADMRGYLVRLLGDRFEVAAVPDGEEALKSARESPPDLVLTDAMMPKLDGFGLLAALRSDPATQTVPVIVLSARAGEEARIEGLKSGADDYLVKPFRARELLARVSSAIEIARVRQEAAAASERAATILESLTDGFYALDRDWRYVYLNAAAERMSRLSRQDVLGRTMWHVFPAVVGGPLERELRRAVAEGVVVEIEYFYEPLARWFKNKVFPSRDGGLSIYFRDITEERRNAEVLDEQRRVLELIAGGSPLAQVLDALCRMVERHAGTKLLASVLTLDPDGIHLRHGAAPSLPGAYYRALDGITIGLSSGSCGAAAYLREPVTTSDIATDRRWGGYAELALSHGLRACWSRPILGSDGGVLGTLAAYYATPREPTDADLHLVEIVVRTAAIAIERRRAEEERERLLSVAEAARADAEAANRVKDEFLATLSHELRTPLNAIVGWSKILRTGKVDADDLQEGLEVIDRNAKAQAQLIEDLLDLSRIMSGKLSLDLQRLRLHEVIDAAVGAVAPAAHAKGVRIQKVLDSLVEPVSGDPTRLQQVVWNLVTNAVKFTPKGGKVQVLLERVNSHVEISVIDTGIGISPEFLPHVFDRFRQADGSTTRQHGGLGLGLAIVKQLVEMHGGTVRVKSPGEGQGSTFVVALPVAIVHPEAPEKVRPKETQAQEADGCAGHYLAGLRVLAVDDEADARNLMRKVLAECGAIVETAGSAAEALGLIEGFSPDVLVSDVGMPERDGYDLIRQVRKKLTAKKLPAAALTAFARSEDRMRALRAGFQVHVAKPVNPDELVAVVAALAGRTGGGEQ